MSGLYKKSIKNVDKELLRCGVQGENKVTTFIIEADEWVSLCQNGSISAIIQTPLGSTHSTGVKIIGSSIIWEITRSETYEAGIGKVQFTLKDSDGTTLKSKIANYIVYPSLTSNPGQQPTFPDTPSETALRLETPREIALTGDISGASMFDGSEDIKIATIVQNLTNLELEEMLK